MSSIVNIGVRSGHVYEVAHARSGDKGRNSNVALIAYDEEGFEILRSEVTEERVKEHFGPVVVGPIVRYVLPNLNALNFVLHDSLGGGGTSSLRADPQGKGHAMWLLTMKIRIPVDYSPRRGCLLQGVDERKRGDRPSW